MQSATLSATPSSLSARIATPFSHSAIPCSPMTPPEHKALSRPTSVLTTEGSGRKTKRMRFSAACDVLILKVVCARDVHVLPHCKTQTRFENSLLIFLDAVRADSIAHVPSPTCNILHERFKKTLSDNLLSAGRNSVASCMIEVRG